MRRSLLLGLLTIVSPVGGCGGGEPTPATAPTSAEILFPPLSPEAVADRIRRLEDPKAGDGPSNNALLGLADEFEAPGRLVREPYDALDDLATLASASVEPDLLQLARTHESFIVRCRAAMVLGERRHSEAPVLVARLCESSSPGERHAAWSLADRMVRPIATSVALDRLQAERDDRLRTDIIEYLGGTRDPAAVPALLALLENGPPSLADVSVRALGCLHDSRAVPAVLAAEHRIGRGTWLQALGSLRTPETVDALIPHLDEYGAVDALIVSRSPMAIPALEKHLAGLADRFPEGKANDLARKDRIALVRLRNDDPCPKLLAIVEDRSADLELRRAALDGAREYDYRDRLLGAHVARLVAFYAQETDPDLLEQCLTTLRDSRAPGVTPAMLHHAAIWKSYLKTPAEYLVRCLNRRLGTNYRPLEEVRARPIR